MFSLWAVLKRLVAGFPLESGSGHVGFVVDKVALGRVTSEYFHFPVDSHSTDCSTIIVYHPGLVQ
jgi:hypothetical protein